MVLDTLTVNTLNWTLDTSAATISAAGSASSAGFFLKQ